MDLSVGFIKQMKNDSEVEGVKKRSTTIRKFNRQTRKILEEKQVDNRGWFTKIADKMAGVEYSGYKQQ